MHLLLSVGATTTTILIKIQNDYKSNELTLKIHTIKHYKSNF